MTVRELKKILEKLNDDMVVMVYDKPPWIRFE